VEEEGGKARGTKGLACLDMGGKVLEIGIIRNSNLSVSKT
jgi:hypothetical protein